MKDCTLFISQYLNMCKQGVTEEEQAVISTNNSVKLPQIV